MDSWATPELHQFCDHPCCVDLAGSGFACHGPLRCTLCQVTLDLNGRIP